MSPSASSSGTSGASGAWNYEQASQPSGAENGETWYDTDGGQGYVYDGNSSSWVKVSAPDHSEVRNTSPADHHEVFEPSDYNPEADTHSKTTAGELNHNDLSSIGSADHHTKYSHNVLASGTFSGGTSETVYWNGSANELQMAATLYTFASGDPPGSLFVQPNSGGSYDYDFEVVAR